VGDHRAASLISLQNAYGDHLGSVCPHWVPALWAGRRKPCHHTSGLVPARLTGLKSCGCAPLLDLRELLLSTRLGELQRFLTTAHLYEVLCPKALSRAWPFATAMEGAH